MNNSTKTDFGELYRNAFAENDPKKKVELLHAVQRAIHDWEATDYGTRLGPRQHNEGQEEEHNARRAVS